MSGVYILAIKPPNLVSCSIRAASSVGLDDGIVNALCKLRHLRRLQLLRCPFMTDTNAFIIAGCLTRLTELSIFKCRTLTTAGVSALVVAAPQLRRLRVSASDHINASGMRSCSRRAADLNKCIEIEHPWELPEDGYWFR